MGKKKLKSPKRSKLGVKLIYDDPSGETRQIRQPILLGMRRCVHRG